MVSRVRRAAIEHLSDMRKKFRITAQQYVTLYAPKVCAICGSPDSIVSGKNQRLVIDHDHKREDEGPACIRGILCHQCNLMLGYAEDNPAMLRAAADYLEDYNENGGPLTRVDG